MFFVDRKSIRRRLKSSLDIRSSIGILFALLLAYCAGAVLIGINWGRPALATGRSPKVALVWSGPTDAIGSVWFTRTGQYFCTSDSGGRISLYESSGARLFSARTRGANAAVTTPDGAYTLAYTSFDPTSDRLTFLDAQGRVHWEMRVSGAVWSADAFGTSAGAVFAVGTGQRYVYIISIDGKRKRYRRWRAPGAVTSLSFDSTGRNVLFGTWQDSSLSSATLSGDRNWTRGADPASLHYIERLTTPDRLLLRSVPNRLGSDEVFSVLNRSGKRIWRGTIRSDAATRFLYSPNALYVCLGYDKPIGHKGKSIIEKHAVLYDASGKKMWDKGSLFFEADPLLVTSGGYVIVSSSDHAIFTIGPSGDPEPAIRLPASVKSVTAAPSGSLLLVRCADGKAYMLRITH